MSYSDSERYLIYLKRELLMMARDPSGGMGNSTYADRVIEDVTGVEGLTSMVLAAEKPSAILIRIIRGPKSKILDKFFSVDLHDTRMELVQLMVDGSKATRSRIDRENLRYLKRLYTESVKKVAKLCGTKPTQRKMVLDKYSNLAELTGQRDSDWLPDPFGIDDDDEDDNLGFSISDYATEYFDAIREGRELPTLTPSTERPEISIRSGASEEIRRVLERAERRIGHKLSPAQAAELIAALEEDEDEDDEESSRYSPVLTPSNIKQIAELAANLVVSKINDAQNGTTEAAEDDSDEEEIAVTDDLDKFLEEQEKAKNNPAPAPTPTLSEPVAPKLINPVDKSFLPEPPEAFTIKPKPSEPTAGPTDQMNVPQANANTDLSDLIKIRNGVEDSEAKKVKADGTTSNPPATT